jgi:ABC-2 type transport system ATP-binding protein
MTAKGDNGASRTTPVVACQRLGKVFRDFWMRPRARAVEDLTFEIAPHEVFGLLGPNGSGKSTTIKMILGLLRPTSGRLVVFGRPATDVAIKSRIGYLPEESFLYPFLNARETLEYYAKLFGIDPKIRRSRIDELLDMVGLTGAQHRPVREYSKGMQRRIGLAQALINDPDFLILDEPTTGLDPIGTRQVKDLIIELGRRGKTILLSSHLLSDVEDVVDRMIILYGGRKRDEGTTDDLLTERHRTTIETDAIDEATIAEIDRLIRERTHGTASILGVSHPRQKLEDKFLDIVQRAQREKLATSGASNDGRTAAFLRGDQAQAQAQSQAQAQALAQHQDAAGPEQGEAVIDRLLAAEAPAEIAGQAAAHANAGTDAPDVVESLLRDEQPAPRPDRTAAGGMSAESGSSGADRSGPGVAPPHARTGGQVDEDLIGKLLGTPDGEQGR